MKATVLYYRCMSYRPESLARMAQLFDVVELDDPGHDTPAVLATIEVLCAPLGFTVDGAKMDCCPRLRAIISNTTGVSHIDLAAAAQRTIRVYALHDEPEFLERITPTAEHTIGLMIAACRRIPAAHQAVCMGRWDRQEWLVPKMLSRMRLGIVGYGRLGRRVSRIADAIGMRVAFYDPFVPGGATSLIELARASDVLSLHAPGNSETAGLVSREVLQVLPPQAVVVNTARGEILALDALLDLLESGHLGAAALDTLDGEYEAGFTSRLATSRVLRYARDHQNLILTPHIGGSTVDARVETERFVIDKAHRALRAPERV